jgi:DNA recombination protein Rad52
MDWDKISVELSKKLDPAHVRPAKARGPKGDYIEGWHAMAEANRIFGYGEWDYAITDCRLVSEREKKVGQYEKDGYAVTYIATVQVFVGSVRRQDVGAGHGYDVDCGLAHESAIKEAVTDALKRALRSFGNPFGLALYDKSRENVGPPEATQQEVDTALESLKGIGSLPELQTYWTNLYRNARHVADNADVLEMKNAMKAQLTTKDAA